MSKKQNNEVINPLIIDNQPIVPFYNLPTSQEANLIQDILGGGHNSRMKHEITTKSSHSGTIFYYKSQNSTVSIKLPDVSRLTGHNSTAEKLFNFLLIKINKQGVFNENGTLKNTVIQFQLEELVSTGMYVDDRAARRGFDTAMGLLQDFILPIKFSTTNNSRAGGTSIKLFKQWERKNGVAFVEVGNELNINALFQYYTPLPKYYFKLNPKAAKLCYFLSFLSRMRTQQIEEDGFFIVNLRTVQEKLNLPSEDGNRYQKQQIREPIEKAIEEIEQAEYEQEQAQPGSQQYRFEIKSNEEASTKEWLDGHIKVYVRGQAREKLIHFEHKKERVIKASITKWEKRKQAREARANKEK